MKVLFCGYRDWSLDVYRKLKDYFKVSDLFEVFHVANTPQQLTALTKSTKYDVIIVVGWSWKVDENTLKNSYVVGMHPSDLPSYAGGSPIQNQIIDGLKSSHASLFKLTPKFDEGPVLAKEQFNLDGHMDDIFLELTRVSFKMLANFLARFPCVTELAQVNQEAPKKRLKPEQSKLDKSQVVDFTCSKLYDLIRCREDPYPNVYLEDETGKLFFKRVEFVKANR